MEKLLSVHEVADRLGISLWTVYRMARDGRLAGIRLGRRRLFAEGDLEQLIRETREHVSEPAASRKVREGS